MYYLLSPVKNSSEQKVEIQSAKSTAAPLATDWFGVKMRRVKVRVRVMLGSGNQVRVTLHKEIKFGC